MRSRNLSVIIFSFILTCSIFAQGRMSLEERVKNLKDQLKLTAAQTEQVTQILKSQSDKMADLRNNSTGDRGSMFENFRVIMSQTDEQILKILNDEQKVEYKKLLKQREERMRNRRRRR